MRNFQQISSFLGYAHDKAFCEEVALKTSFENMKSSEKQKSAAILPPGFWKDGQEGFIRNG